ncbi:DUF1624 domain-containing protein [Martelella alba]|uniref:DUF1624 domain-containing protein n=1 Tax=Martelella alba TaxID=2590451 RepID=A0A506U8H8_9HYPH|nr:heparan-alpha-glucosaminide N-acetyltransferase [Martelella alba]TPW29404.1 DUF1624 domain-containing protein [Martelella alba]
MTILNVSNAALTQKAPRPRIHILDAARGIALIAMAIYHFTWDLDHFGYVDPGLSTRGGFAIFAHAIAASFLFIAGYSLYMAHGRQWRMRAFAKRLAILVVAGAAITVVSIITTPNAIIYFGILQAIAVSSIIGLAFVRLPAPVTLVAGIAAFALPFFIRPEFFDPRYLAWITMPAHPPISNDYVPLLPWIGPFLIGIAASRLTLPWLKTASLWPKRENGFTFLGRHSLIFYLLHQPVLFGLVFLATLFVPPDLSPAYLSSCQTSCEASDSAAFCTSYCSCTLDRLKEAKLFTPLMHDETTDGDAIRLNQIAMMCSVN